MLELDFAKQGGLVTAIAQDADDGTILMVAYMNEESWKKTLETGVATYWSRSRQQLWIKGESSGNTQIVREVFVDCDEDAVLLKIEQKGGAACHKGYRSCFFRKVDGDGNATVNEERVFDPSEVYDK